MSVFVLLLRCQSKSSDMSCVLLHFGAGSEMDDAVPHKLVVARVVQHLDNSRLAGDALGAPREVSRVEA